MHRNDLLKLLNKYKQSQSSKDQNDMCVHILELFLVHESIEHHGINNNISFSDFADFIIASFPKDNLSNLFSRDYLNSDQAGAILFQKFIGAGSAVESNEALEKLAKSNRSSLDKKPASEPDMQRYFEQGVYIMVANSIFASAGERAPLNAGGACCALTFMWYECLSNGRDLINELMSIPTNKQLIKNVGRAQENTHQYKMEVKKRVEFTLATLKEQLAWIKERVEQHSNSNSRRLFLFGNKDISSLVDKTPEFVSNIMASFNFSEARERAVRSNEFAEYIDELHGSKKSDDGLHTISVTDLKFQNCHIIGWTYKNERYIVFDANQGEAYFNSFEKLKSYLCDLVNDYSGVGVFGHDKRGFVVRDYYRESLDPTPSSRMP